MGTGVVAMVNLRRAPGPIADLWEWQLRGSCRDVDPAVFFHPDGERGPARALREATAKAVCATCPVLRQCRTHALRAREPYGVWGGLSEADREEMFAGRRRGWRSAG
jgi:WhiB family redox-sensing transcriptional regulator